MVSPASIALHYLDLLGTRRLDPRAAALLDPPAHPNATPREPLRLEAGRRESALVALGNGDRKVVGPPPAEVHIDRGAALADRQHLAFDDRKPSSFARDGRRVFGPSHHIIRIGP